MARKNISTGVDNAAAVVDLDDDDEIVKTVLTETRVGRRKRLAEPPALAGGTDAEIEQDDDNAIDAELLDDDEPEYSENSLAALIYDEDSENRVDNKFCSVAVRRNPDSMNDKFRNPCGAVTNYPPLRNIELTADRMDIEDKVRAENGGGHYFFQIHLNGRLGPSWKATLSDDPRTLAATSNHAAATQPAAAIPPPSPVVDPLDALIENLDKFAKLKTVFGGGEKTEKEIRMEYEIAELRREIEAAKNAPAERKSERLTLFEAALNAGAGNPLQSKILDNLFPSEEKEPRHWIADTLDVALQHKEEILAIAGPLFMSLLGGGQPQQMPPPGMIPQQIPPPAFPAPPPMQFAPRTPEPFEPMPAFDPPPVLEPETVLQEVILEAEPEPKPDTPPKRSRAAKAKDEEPDNSNAIDAEEEANDAAAKP